MCRRMQIKFDHAQNPCKPWGMKNLIALLILALSACTTAPKYKDLQPIETAKSDQIKQSPSPAPSATPQANPQISLFPEIEMGEVLPKQSKWIELSKQAILKANEVLKSDCFKIKILNGKFTENNGLTNLKIYELLSSKKIKGNITFFYGTFYQNHIAKTVGIDKGTGVVFANSYYVGDSDTLASLILHEAEGHGQGFHHYGVKETSVPYSLNSIYDECAQK